MRRAHRMKQETGPRDEHRLARTPGRRPQRGARPQPPPRTPSRPSRRPPRRITPGPAPRPSRRTRHCPRRSRSRPAPAWRADCESALRAWKTLAESARQAGTVPFYMDGYSALITRIRALAADPEIPAGTREALDRALQAHEGHAAARSRVEGWLESAVSHIEAHAPLRAAALDLEIETAETAGYAEWKREAERLAQAGEAILSDRTCGPHLAAVSMACTRIEWAVTDMAAILRRDGRAHPRCRRAPRGAGGHRQPAGARGGGPGPRPPGGARRRRVQPAPVRRPQRHHRRGAQGGPEGLRRLLQPRGPQVRRRRRPAAPQPHDVDAAQHAALMRAASITSPMLRS